jgi:hypothetical protein
MELLHKLRENIVHNSDKAKWYWSTDEQKPLTVCLLRSKWRKYRFGLFIHVAGERVASRGDNSFSEEEQSVHSANWYSEKVIYDWEREHQQ